MPRPKKADRPGPNSVIASAARLNASRTKGNPQTNQGGSAEAWQIEAWRMLDAVGELNFYLQWKANAMSRVQLTVMLEDVDGVLQPVPDDDPAALALDELFGGESGQSQMLATMAQHLDCPGETWLVGLTNPDRRDPDSPDQWRVLWAEEIEEHPDRWVIDRGDGNKETLERGDPAMGTPPEALVIRIWRPHPRRWVEATSSVRSALPILRELQGLTQHVAASIDSRLAGAGILCIPSELTFSTPDEGDIAGDPLGNTFISELTDAMMTALADRGSAAAVVPTVVSAPGAVLGNIKHITFSTPLDDRVMDLKDAAIKRLATALDTPAEILTGMADVNHWTGWLLDEQSIKMHVEPGVELICNAITTRFLWPALQGSAPNLDPAIRRYRVIGDTSRLRQRPDKSTQAVQLHAALVITDAALAREAGGFDGDDLLDPVGPEYRRRLAERITAAGADPATVVAALGILGLNLPAVETMPAVAPAAAPPPAIEAPPVQGPPVQPDQPPAAAGLIVASDLMVRRALERAWNRVGKRGRTGRRPVAADQLDACLADAWEHLPYLAASLTADEERLRDVCESYTRAVLSTGAEHKPEILGQLVMERVLTDA